VELPPEFQVPGWVVDRPAELTAVVRALGDRRAATVGITTGLFGAGGFGKTTLALMVCADPRVRRSFRGRVYLVTVGRDVRGAADIALKVNDVIKLVAGEDASFTDPQLAGQHLGSLLDAGPRRLLVLDDVWEPVQLAPFTLGGRQCARLVTTRVPELLAGRGLAVRVDQMSKDQAEKLLKAGLPGLDEQLVARLLAATGRWPLLLRLVNKILVDYAQLSDDIEIPVTVLLERLAADGPAVVDEMLGENPETLNVGEPSQRERAVRATIEASTDLLSAGDAERLAELGVFAEDETIPFDLVARLWRATSGLDQLQAAQTCHRLAQLALVSQVPTPVGGVDLHDVIREYLRSELGQERLAGLNGLLLDAIAATLPVAPPVDSDEGQGQVAWWELGRHERYLLDHLVEHLQDAHRKNEAQAIACDLRWVAARLERFGPAAPTADLAAVQSSHASRLQAVLERTAHLLAATEPANCVVDVLNSRVAEDPDWGPQASAAAGSARRPRLVSLWPLPDLPDPALRRVLAGHTHDVDAIAVAPDGAWLVSAGSEDGTLRVWDTVTGQQRAMLAAGSSDMSAVAVAPDGSWLASASSDDKKVRIWDLATGQQRAVLTGHTEPVRGVAVAPDGRWLASGGWDGVRIWDAATGHQRAVLSDSDVDAVAIAPDGSWLVSGSRDGTVSIWDTATGQQRAVLTGHTGLVTAVAIAPDGSWLVSADRDGPSRSGTLRIWDAVTGQQRKVLGDHGAVRTVAVAPDGSWLASGGDDGTVRIWDAATGQQLAVLATHAWIWAVAVAPDGSWLASGGRDGMIRIWDVAGALERSVPTSRRGEAIAVTPDSGWLAFARNDGTVQIWDMSTGQPRVVVTGQISRWALAVAPDGSWLAFACDDGTVQIWDTVTGRQRSTIVGHIERKTRGQDGQVTAMAVAPDGTWLASVSRADKTVRIWDAITGQQRAVLAGHIGPPKDVAVAPDGSWLASVGHDRKVRIWDVASSKQRTALTVQSYWVEAVAIAPDGSWLASGNSDDGTLHIWEVATGRLREVVNSGAARVTAVAIAPNGRWLASGGDDGTVRVWDTTTWRPQAVMRTESIGVTCTWLGSGALVVSGSAGLYLFGFLTEAMSPESTAFVSPLLLGRGDAGA
jgi:WD40 repeat protein